MGLRIATNVQSLAAQRTLAGSLTALRSSQEKLAIGSRIVRSADDSAGLAISEKMKADIRSLGQDLRNANDGISILQATEGGINEIGNILMRFRELSVQAASDTVGDVERGFIDKEVQQLAKEVDHIAESIEFNGRIKLMNGQGDDIHIQVGLKATENDRFFIKQSDIDCRMETLGIDGISVTTKESARENLGTVDHAITLLSERRATLGALQNRLNSAIDNLQIYRENLSAANSRIRDTDFASETSESVKQNILAQTGVSVLAQANQSPMQALKLLSN
jgi:flagellin